MTLALFLYLFNLECIVIKFGKGTFTNIYALIVQKCNQKCLDQPSQDI